MEGLLSTGPTPSSSLTHPLWKYLQNIITLKPLELGTRNVDKMFTIPYVSYVTCHASGVTCHVSHITCHVSHVTLVERFIVSRMRDFFVLGHNG